MKVYQLSEGQRWAASLSQTYRRAAIRGVQSAAFRIVGVITSEIIPSTVPTPVNRRTYVAAWRAEPFSTGADIINDAPHAPFIEHGVAGSNVKIGRAMIDALTEWVRMKGIGGRVVTSRSGTQRLVKASVDEARAIAWAIAKTMQQKGIFDGGRGLRILERAMERAGEIVRQEIVYELAKGR